jgi:hypothetical protein
VLRTWSRLFRSVGFEKVAERPSERWGVAVVEEGYVLHPFGRRHPSATDWEVKEFELAVSLLPKL